jgi:hypothetical protein
MEFLEKLENGPYLIEVQNLSMKGSSSAIQKSASAEAVDVNLLIKAYAKP